MNVPCFRQDALTRGFIIAVRDANLRLYQFRMTASLDGTKAVAHIIDNPFGFDGFELNAGTHAGESFVAPNGFLFLNGVPYSSELFEDSLLSRRQVASLVRHWALAFSAFMETGRFPELPAVDRNGVTIAKDANSHV